ncbi:MAG: GNAT family N-acetyltransferase [Sphingomonadales bacterium]|nr:GNAT family N-acetyltransferase [Sphingomonadales bacterium]
MEISKISIREIENIPDDIAMLGKFLNLAGSSLQSFRYFSTRNLDIIRNHVATILLFLNEEPIGYGHLDKDGKNIWLGICIAEAYRGKGLGTVLIKKLIEIAKLRGVSELSLRVDRDNINAITLYKSNKFIIAPDDNDKSYLMKASLS